MPARATLFTGRTPRGHGVRTNGIPLSREIPTMTEAVRQAGYRTHGVGKIHLNTFGLPRGMKPDDVDPARFPESGDLWRRGRVRCLPSPYFGLEKVECAIGHGAGVAGDYLNWLREQRPDGEKLLRPEAGTSPRSGAEQSWKMALPEELHCSRWIADRAVAFLEEQAKRPEPFFLWCSFPDPHHPYCPPAPWCNMYDPAEVAMPARREGELDDLAPFFRRVYEEGIQLSGRRAPTKMRDDQIREIIALTYGMISLFDHHIGCVLDALAETGLRENTVVLFTSDHGDMMGDHWLINKGPFHFDGLLKIPLLWSWPKHFRSGEAADALASQLDIAPTILDLASVPIPEGPVPREREAGSEPSAWPGKSLLPVVSGQHPSIRDSVIIENDEDYLGLRLRTLVTERHQLTVYSGQDYGELFDTTEDPRQLHNLWNSPAHRLLRQELHCKLLHELLLSESALPRRLSHA
jgi:arylsulfatase